MKKSNKYFFLIVAMIMTNNILSQTYQQFHIKEEYERISESVVNTDDIEGLSGYNYNAATLGDRVGDFLNSLLRMYKTTGDKAYLIKFVNFSYIIQNVRNDEAFSGDHPGWAYLGSNNDMYLDGRIVQPMAEFCFIVRNNIELYSKILPTAASLNIDDPRFFPPQTSFGTYSEWLAQRVSQTLDWYINHGYWDDSFGYRQNYGDDYAAPINMQANFATAMFFLGSIPQYSGYLSKVNILAGLYHKLIYIDDPCESVLYTEPVFRVAANDSYWWYHSGWRVYNKKDCSVWSWWPPSWNYYWDVDDYTGYTLYVEDISHALMDLFFPQALFNNNYGSYFTGGDMTRWKNTFTLNIHDGYGNFNNGVNGVNSVFNYSTINDLKYCALAWMPFYNFDDDPEPTRNVYDIIMNFYKSEFVDQSINTSLLEGLHYLGLSEVVAAQWDRECVNLTLYNRKVVYDQDFFVKNNLYVSPEESFGDSYADPVISDEVFYNDPGIKVTMTAGNSIELNPGFEGNPGFEAYIDPSLNCSMSLKSTGHGNRDISEGTNNKPVEQIMMPERMLKIYPNPNNGSFTVDVPGAENYSVFVYTLLGETILVKENTNLSKLQIDLKGNKAGTFIVKVITQESIWYEKVVAE